MTLFLLLVVYLSFPSNVTFFQLRWSDFPYDFGVAKIRLDRAKALSSFKGILERSMKSWDNFD